MNALTRLPTSHSYHPVDDETGFLFSDFTGHSIRGQQLNAVLASLSMLQKRNLVSPGLDLLNSPYFHYAVLKLRSFGVELVPEATLGSQQESFSSGRGSEFLVSEKVSIAYHCGHAQKFHSEILNQFKSDEDYIRIKIIAVDSYLDPGIPSILEREASRQDVVLCKLLGDEIWIGPYIPQNSDNWRLQLQRLALNFPVQAELASRFGICPVGTWRMNADPVRQAVSKLLSIAKTHIAERDIDHSAIYTLRSNSSKWIPHRYIAIAEKPAIANVSAPPKAADGGHRSLTAESMVKHCLPVIDPLLGIVPELYSVTVPAGVNVCFTQQNFPSPHAIKEGRISAKIGAAAGKGETKYQAMASCIGEAIERYAAGFQGTEEIVFGSYDELQPQAINPQHIMLFDDKQYENRVNWNRRSGVFQHVPEPFRQDIVLGWQRCENLLNQEIRLVAASLVYFRYHNFFKSEPTVCVADSNGCASGSTLAEAKLQGLYEIIERDACAIWWYNRMRCKGFHPEHFSKRFVKDSYARYEEYGRTLHLLDLTSDTQIPVVIAISADSNGTSICVGLGCNLNYEIAASRAIAELDQFVAAVGLENIGPKPQTGNIELDAWLRREVLSEHPYLEPSQIYTTAPVFQSFPTIDEELIYLAKRVNETIGPAYCVNLTRPEIPLYVVKIFVPGARHFWARFAAGRLFDIPVKINPLSRSLEITELNPIPFFL